MRRLIYRRTHSPDIIAEAATSESDVRWRASAWRVSDLTTLVRSPRGFEARRAACAVADALARKTFAHKCDFSTCSDWRRFDSED
jgi:hypothetical protein